MKTRSKLLAALSALTLTLAAGCVGELGDGVADDNADDNSDDNSDDDPTPVPDDDNGDQDTPRALFDTNVAPIIIASCGGGTCHESQSPAFVNTSPANTYDTFMAFKDQLVLGFNVDENALLSHGDGSHKGILFSDGDVSQIQAWIASEKLLADGGGGTVSPLAKWSGCMNYDEWVLTDVADQWANKGSDDGDCQECHNLAAEGAMYSNADRRVFDYVTQVPHIMPSYFTQTAEGEVIINRTRIEAVALGTAPHQVHPQFNIDGGNAMEALQEFYDLTMIRYNSTDPGACQAPRF